MLFNRCNKAGFSRLHDFLVLLDITKATGMCPYDIATTLQFLNLLTKKDGKMVVTVSKKLIEDHIGKLSSKEKRAELDPDSLRWMPLVTNQPSSGEEEDNEDDKATNDVSL